MLEYVKKIDVFTDGSLKKTKLGNSSGYGIYFPNRELKNVAAPFTIGEITNNRAELYAIYQAILRISKNFAFDEINIFTDSEYSQKSLTEWIKIWRTNNWKSKNNKPIKNLDILKKINRYLLKYPDKINIYWVRSHSGSKDILSINNDKADILANKGADKYREKYLVQTQ